MWINTTFKREEKLNMKAIFITSNMDTDIKRVDHGLTTREPKVMDNINNIITNLKAYLHQHNNLLIIASQEKDYEANDYWGNIMIDSFKLTLPFENYTILDGRNKILARELVGKADLIVLSGGHTPTENKFFQDIKLKDYIKNTNGVIIGISAGSMNMATTVYAPPELEGETEENYKRFFSGLGLTEIKILPHYDVEKDSVIDNLRYLEDIVLPDSYISDFVALNNGSYIILEGERKMLFGESYLIRKGQVIKICDNDNYIDLDKDRFV